MASVFWLFHSRDFLTGDGGLSLESERQRISSGPQDIPEYSNRYKKIVVCRVSILHLIYNFCNLFLKLLGSAPSVPTTIGITITSHCIFSSLVKYKYLSIFSFSCYFTLSSTGKSKFFDWQIFFRVNLDYVWASSLYPVLLDNFMSLIF